MYLFSLLCQHTHLQLGLGIFQPALHIPLSCLAASCCLLGFLQLLLDCCNLLLQPLHLLLGLAGTALSCKGGGKSRHIRPNAQVA